VSTAALAAHASVTQVGSSEDEQARARIDVTGFAGGERGRVRGEDLSAPGVPRIKSARVGLGQRSFGRLLARHRRDRKQCLFSSSCPEADLSSLWTDSG
jgi:hypothetical protein